MTYTYDAWGNILSITGPMADTLGADNPLLYRGYVYDSETGLYYLQSRYYNPEWGRFINADSYVSTGQGLLGNNMFAYCNNNPVMYSDYQGTRFVEMSVFDGGGNPTIIADTSVGDGESNIKSMMRLFGVNTPSELPELPNGAMVFVENSTSFTINAVTYITGTTIVMDKSKYCVYTFWGIGRSISPAVPIDRIITQGYVYGVNQVEDYCGYFVGTSSNLLATASGGAIASNLVHASILGGMNYVPSVGVSITYYITLQTDWIYGDADLSVITTPYRFMFSAASPQV